jgi:hypothetical protein
MNIYRPVPTRAWARVQPVCSSYSTNTQLSKEMLEKGNVLQYKKNSANLTKSQKYALIARGMWINRTKTYASQSDICSNPNTNSLKREGGEYICNDRSTQFQYNVLNPFMCTEIFCNRTLEVSWNPIDEPANENAVRLVFSVYGRILLTYFNPEVNPLIAIVVFAKVESLNEALIDYPGPWYIKQGPSTIYEQLGTVYTAIVDGGVLLGNQTVNPCTQVLEKTTYLNPCNLTTASDVPGKVQPLCWDLRLQPWYTRERYIMNTSGNKWPVNYKNFNVAYVPKLSVSVNLNEVSLSWTYCYRVQYYRVFQNDVLLSNTSNLTIPPFTLPPGTYKFYVIAVVANASSGPSNIVEVVI